MDEVVITFQRGGMPFEAKITDKSCVIKDLSLDQDSQLYPKFEIKQIIINTGQNASVQVQFETGVEAPSGAILNAVQRAWRFDSNHPDLEYFQQQFGKMFMGSCVNGFVKHYMKNSPRYFELESAFNQVMDNSGNYLPDNND